ncbi:MAG: methyltransferase domain-containing protein [Chloroflexi bacterium]|nr:methyltransferase domain-containing protein [Chloroflexota bacterium]
MSASEGSELRKALVDALKRKGDLDDPAIEAALLAIPRHFFLPDEPLERAYADEAVPVKRDSDGMVLASASQPSMIVLMLQQLQLRPGDNVLEIGAGTGYNAAIMQHIIGSSGTVTSIELDPQVAKQARINLQHAGMGEVNIVEADGAMGYPVRAQYDRIIATVAVWDIPPAWVRQLKSNGILVAPVGGAAQYSAAFKFEPDDSLYSPVNIPCRFIALRGIAAGPTILQRINATGLILVSDHISQLDPAATHMLLSEDEELNYLGAALSPGEYWQGFLPYLELNTPEDYLFASYVVADNQQAYGLEGTGFALVSPGSACFVPFQGQGDVHCYGGADAFMALREVLGAWEAAGRPGSDRLRMRLLPKKPGRTAPPGGKVYSRLYHDLMMWLDTRA